MGVDYRVDIVATYESQNNRGFAEHITSVEMCGMASGFEELFDRPLADYGIEFYPNISTVGNFSDDCKVDGTTTDKYGRLFMVASNRQKVIDWLKKDNENQYYRRDVLLLNILKGLKKKDWDDCGRDIYVVLSAH